MAIKKIYDVSKPFKQIDADALKPLDMLVYYHGNKLTELHGSKLQRAKYGKVKPSPYHANLVMGKLEEYPVTIIADTEIRHTASVLDTEYLNKKAIRIDVVRVKNIPEDIWLRAMHLVMDMVGRENWYGGRRFVGYASRIYGLGWLNKFPGLRPSKKELVCSNRTVKPFMLNGIEVSYQKMEETIPSDIIVYAMDHPDLMAIYTLKERGEIYDYTK